MQSITINTDQLAVIMAQFDRDTKFTSGMYFHPAAANDGTGDLFYPDSLASQITAAQTASAQTAQNVLLLKAYAATIRYDKETGGITLNGVAVSTDRTSQSMIGNAVALLSTDSSIASIKFKQSDGTWRDIDRADMITLGQAVGTYVQACFGVEYTTSQSIDAGTITTTAQIDAISTWPSTTVTTSSSTSS